MPAILHVLLALATLQGSSAPGNAATITTQPVSPSVLGTFITRESKPDLIILWRGHDRWFLKSRQRSSSGGGRGSILTQTLDYGGVHLEFSYDRATRQVRIGAKTFAMPEESNVVLIDRVDEGTGAALDGFAHVDFTATPHLTFADIFRASSSAVAFLRCDVDVDDPANAQLRTFACNDLTR